MEYACDTNNLKCLMQFDQEHPYYTLQKSYFIAAVGRKEIPVLAKQQNNSGQNEVK